jgi:hypothetical protein
VPGNKRIIERELFVSAVVRNHRYSRLRAAYSPWDCYVFSVASDCISFDAGEIWTHDIIKEASTGSRLNYHILINLG